MNKAARLIAAVVILSIASTLAVAQHANPLFFNIENAIRQKEPEWTLMNRWPAPQGQSIGFLWRLDHQEISALIILEPSKTEAIKHFQDDGLGPAPAKTPRQNLDIGDECYLRQSGRHTAVVLRKNNLLVRLGSESSGPELLSRFARHIGAVLEELLKSSDATTEREEAESRRRKGELALKDGDYQAAIEEFRKAIELDGDSTEAHYQLGTAYYETGEYKLAAGSFAEAIRLKPDFFDAFIALGKSYQHSGLHLRAVAVLQKAVPLRPDSIDARTALGSALIRAGQPQDAVVVLQEVVRFSPESAFVYGSLGQAYRLTGKYAEALNALEQAQRISPEDPVVHNYLGLTYETLSRQQEAITAYRQAIVFKPDYAEAHYNLALLYLSLGDRNQAQAEYNTLRNLNADLAEALLRKMGEANPRGRRQISLHDLHDYQD